MLAIVARTQGQARILQLRLLASCAMATSMISFGDVQAAASSPAPPSGANAAFQGTGTVVSGSATILQTSTLDTITVASSNTVINFTPFDTANGGGPITFLPSGRTGLFQNDPNSGVTNFTVLNRIITSDATRAIRFDGIVQSRIANATGGTSPGGTILFYSPGGIIASSTSVFDVGSLVLSAADVGFGERANTFRFSGATSGAAVDINAGALISARGAGSYVALVAPRIIQSGNVKSDGSIGYIAAEAVDVTIQNNLFDISFVQGIDGGAAVTHNGTTELTRAPNDTSPQRIYVAAVPKNDAITTLISGSLGYSAATSASVRNGAIILSAGRNVSDSGYGASFTDFTAGTAPANITIGADGATIFNASLLTNATGDALIAPAVGTTIQFNNSVALNADRLAEVRAVATSIALFNAGLSVSSNNLVDGAAARVIAIGETGYGGSSGLISVIGNLAVDGGPSQGVGEVRTPISLLAADLGRVTVSGSANVKASDADSVFARNAFGGSATVRVGAVGSRLSAAGLVIEAGARGVAGLDENEMPIAGNATGGTANLILGGGTFAPINISFDSSAVSDLGGVATGGATSLVASGGVVGLGTIMANVSASALQSGDTGTEPEKERGAAFVTNESTPLSSTGGTIQFDVTDTVININGDLLLNASASGSEGIGSLQGGTIAINANNGSLLVGDLISANVSAEEAASALGVQPGEVRGGTITALVSNNGDILASAMNYGANAVSGGDTFGGAVSLTTDSGGRIRSTGTIRIDASAMTRGLESAGDSVGGNIVVNINSGSLQSGPLVLDANALGGDAIFGGISGSALGGSARVNISGGDSVIESFRLTTDATGGRGGLGNGGAEAGGAGGAATAGTSEINITKGVVRTAGLVISSSAIGGDGGEGTLGGEGGVATGGRAAVLTSEAATLFLMKLATNPQPTPLASSVNSSARGGSGGLGQLTSGGAGGAATGGTSILTLAGADIQPNSPRFAVDLTVNSEASGGLGGASNSAGGGAGGSAMGGTATLNLINNHIDFSNVALSTRGSGGSGGRVGNSGYGALGTGGTGGNGSAGMASVTASAPLANIVSTNIANLAVAAEAVGGSGGNGAIGGSGGNALNGGSASFTQTSGAITSPIAILTANSFGGHGGDGFDGNGGNGGNSLGGTARITGDGATANLTINNSGAVAVARSGAGGNTQSGQNNATGGNAGTATGGTAQIFAKNGSTVNLTIAATANARSFGELGGSSSNGNGGAGGGAIGGAAQIDGSGGRLVALDLTSASGGFGGAGGNAGYGSLGNGGAGGLATGGTSAITNADFITQNSTAFVGAFGVGGAGGSASNGNGGDGGAATGGIARVDGRADLLTATNLTVTAGVIGGNAGYGGMGTGGTGGAGIGGIVRVTNAQFNSRNSSAFIGSNAGGGNGGTGRIGGDGGAAIGGTTNFAATNTTNLIGTLDVSASTAGGMGGAQIAGSAGGRGGNGGTGQGGDAQITIAGGAFNATNAIIRSTAGGGEGGFGETGGNGGLATGGTAILSNTSGAVIQIGSLNLTVGAGGGSGGQASDLGGNGGNAQAGTAAVSISGGAFQASDIMIRSAAAGGISDLSANGGSAIAGTARLTASNSATLSAGNASIISDATSNSFVTQVNTQPTANTATSATNGHATGGIAEFNVLSGSTLSGGTVTLSANAMIGRGRGGGVETSPAVPVKNGGMPDGLATGGTVSVIVNNATVLLTEALNLSTDANAMLGIGQGGMVNIFATGGTLTTPSTNATANGNSLVSGTEIGGRGGSIDIRTTATADATAGVFNLGSTNLEASGVSTPADGSEAITNAAAGHISITASGGQTTATNFSILSAKTLGRNSGGFNPNAGIFLNADTGAIIANSAVTLLSDESISVSAMGTGNVFVGNDLRTEALNTITVSHSGRSANANTILAASVNLIAGNDFNAMSGSRIRSDNDLTVTSRLGGISAGDLVAGDDVLVTARNGPISILSATALGTGLDAPANRRNIIIDSGAFVSLDSANAQSTLAVRGTSITGANLAAGEDVVLSATGNISVTGVLAGDDFSATSSGGNITLGGVTTNGTGIDDRTVDFGYGEIGFVATATDGSQIAVNAGYGNISLGMLNSAGATTLMAANSVTGSASTAGGLLSVMTNSIDVDSLTSTGNSVNASARLVDIDTTIAGLDIIINTKGLANSIIALGTATAARGISLTSGGANNLPIPNTMSSVFASSITAGDDIDVFATGNVNITSALTDGSFDSGYGGDPSNINVTTSFMGRVNLTTGRAKDNFTISTGIGGASSAGSLTADRGDLLVNGQMSANIAQATATLGSVTLNAAFVNAGNVVAGTDANVNFFVNGTLGTVAAARDVTVTGSGQAMLTATSLVAGDDVMVTTGGNATITSARATDSLNTGYGGDPSDLSVASMMGAVSVATGQARDNLTLTATNGVTSTTSLTADRGALLINGGSSASINQANATLGLATINADAVNAMAIIAGTDIDINFGAGNAILGNMTAGNDVNIIGTGNAIIGNASAMRDLVTMVDGDVAITSASAERNLRDTSANLTATTLSAGTDVIVLTNEALSLGTTNAGARIVANAGTSINFTQLMTGTTTSLVAGTSIIGGNANAGSRLTLNANGGVVGFGMLSSVANASITASGAIMGNSANAGGALTLNSGANGITATALMSGISNNLTVTASNGGAATIISAISGLDLSVNASNVSVTVGTAARDVLYSASGNISAGQTNAGRDILFNASSTLVSGTATALNNVTANSAGSAELASTIASNIFVVATGDVTLGTANAAAMIGVNANNITGTQLAAGEDIRLIANSAANIGSATAGDDADISGATGLTLGAITTAGTARDDRSLVFNAPSFSIVGSVPNGSDISLMSNGAVSATNLNAGEDIRVNSAALASIASSARRMIDVVTSGNQSLGTASAHQGPINGTSTAGMITFVDLSSGEAINLNAASGISGGSANAAGSIQFMGRNGAVMFDMLTSGGSTNLSSNIGITGTAVNAGTTVQLNSDLINIGALSSNFDSIFVTGRDIIVGTSNAGLDIIVDTRQLANSSIALGTVTAGRDIILSGASNGLTATSLLASDDIEIDITGNAKINLARTTGSFNAGYGDHGYGDWGYGGDLSNITLNAAQAMIGTAQATDNVTLTTITGTMAGTVIADRGVVLVNGGTSANIMNTTATLGSVTINANVVAADNVNAATDVGVNFGASAMLGTMVAGDAISVIGSGSMAFTSLTSGSATTIMAGGSVTGGTAIAGGLLSVMADSFDVDSLTSTGSNVVASARSVDIGSTTAAIDVLIDTKGLANSSITLGTVTTSRDISLTGGTSGITSTSLTANDDIDVVGAGNVNITTATATGSFNTGYGQVTDPSNLSITANSGMIMLGNGRTKDNVTLTTTGSATATSLTADQGAILVNGGTSANIDLATSTLGSITINAAIVNATSINAATDFDLRFSDRATVTNAVAGGDIRVDGFSGFDFTNLSSGGATNIVTGGIILGGSVTGRDIAAGGPISITTGVVEVDNIVSRTGSVTLTAFEVDAGFVNAANDINVDTTLPPLSSQITRKITLSTASAVRDINLTGGADDTVASMLIAGDDITVAANGNVMIGAARASDALSVTTNDSSTVTATLLTADQGAILVNGGASANIMQSTATLSSVIIAAASVNAANISAATNANVNFGTSATLGTVSAGQAIAATGTGSLTYTNLTSGSSTTLATDGAVNGRAASAGSDFIANRTGSFAATGSTNAIGQVSITGRSVATANVTSGTTTSLTASQGAIVTGNVAGGTGVMLRASDTVTSGTVTATANNVDVTAANGITLGSTNSGTTINLTNSSGALTTGALIAGNDITVTNGGAINLASASAADDVRLIGGAGVMLGAVSTRGGADQDGDGNDIVIRAVGPITVVSAITQPNALSTSDVSLTSTAGSINAVSVTARGAVTAAAATGLTAGSATSGTNIALTGQMINATTLTAATNIMATSSGAIAIGDARAVGGNVSLTAAGALSAMNTTASGDVRLTSSNGGNISTGTLSSGSGDIVIASDGSATMTGNTSSGRNLNVTARNLLSVGGVANGLSIDLRSSDIAVNTTSGRIGEQDRTTVAQLTNTGSGVTTIGGTGVTTGYSLSNAEAQRIFAGDIIITAARTASPPAGTQTPSTLNAAAPDVVLDALTLTGATGQTGATAGNIGASGRLRIETPGKLRTVGAVAISNLASANRFQVNAAQSIEVDAATGSVSLSGAGGALGGTIELTAPSVIAASLTAIGAVAAAVDGRAVNDRLAINDNAISDVGTFSANGIIVNVTNGFFVQNSGIKELSAFSFGDRRGVTVGSGGLTINAASPTTRIFVSGRQVQPNGTFITGVDFLRQQTINGTRIQLSTFPPTPFDSASTVNGCAIINSAACLITIDGGSIARDVIGQSDDETSRGGSSSDANFVQFQFKNLDEANFQPVIDEPVTGVGNDDLYALFDARDCTDDQNLEGCTKPK